MKIMAPTSNRIHRRLTTLVISLFTIVISASCSRPGFLPAADRDLNVLVITLDTIRADRLGAYGNSDIRTGFVDRLATRGVVFDRCIAPTPLTLPSHTSLFTGTYPAFHGVRDNGNYVVPDELTTMAELADEAGYRTGAFVGAFVLSSRWGLDQGFSTYTEPKGGYDPALVSFAQIQRPANEVVDDAIEWLRADSEQPFFAWIHLYDPHLPYDPPPEFAQEYAGDPYLGEVAFADSQLGRLEAFLESANLDARTLIVFAGDHGEGLGDHGEFDHGLLLYQTTTRVPLIIVHPSMRSGGVRRPEVVSLVDILPTVAEAVGFPLPKSAQGQSLWPLIGGGGVFDEKPAVAETHYPKLHFGWSPLTALQDRRFQLIDSSDPELYDLERDPQQEHDLFDAEPEVAERMARELEELMIGLGQGALDASSTPDAETIAKLAALGYVAGGTERGKERPIEELPSPRSMLWLYNSLIQASSYISSGDEAEGENKLLEIVGVDDSLVDAWVALGRLYRRQGRLAESLSAFRRAHAERPLDPFLVSKLANALTSSHQFEEAERLLTAAREKHPEDPYIVFAFARMLEASGRFAESEAMFRKVLDLDPRSAPSHLRLAVLALRRGDLGSVGTELNAALHLDPRVAEASLVRGQLLERENRLDEAAIAYREELSSSPNSLPAAIALSRLEGRLGHPAEQERVLRDAIRENPRSPGPYLVLALTFLLRGERYAEAVEIAELGLQQDPKGQELQMAYFLLANLHDRLGDSRRASEYARLAAEVGANRGGGS
jgi:arylsulfatase A-like enzyme/tetratricopeptide (TPR) repeat protein